MLRLNALGALVSARTRPDLPPILAKILLNGFGRLVPRTIRCVVRNPAALATLDPRRPLAGTCWPNVIEWELSIHVPALYGLRC